MTEEQRQLAVGAQRTAEQQRQLAVGAQRTAEQQRQAAEEQRQVATQAQQQAESSKNRAVAASEQAQQARQRAEYQQRLATSAQRDAEAQRAKAVARTVAIEAVQLPDGTDQQVAALLALAAFDLNLSNGGQLNNPDIFNALAKATNLQVVLRGHTDNVRAVAVSAGPGQPLLASGSDDGTVRLGPVATTNQPGQVLRAARKGTGGMRSVLFSPDGQRLYAGSETGSLLMWNVSQPTTPPVAVPAHGAPVHTLLWQPGAAAPGLLVSVSANGTVRSWRPRAGGGLDSVQRVQAPAGMALYCARFTNDGKRLVCGANQNRIISFDAKDLRARPAVFTRASFGARVTALAFSPTGNRLVTGNSRGLVYAWQLTGSRPDTTGRLLSGRHTSTVSDLVYSPNGKQLASCSADWTIHLWDTATMLDQQPPVVLTDFGAWVMSICFTPDGKRLVGGSADRTVRIRTINMTDMYNQLARQLNRSLTREEWVQYVGKDIPYPDVKKP
jgi:WD40 repeat protein